MLHCITNKKKSSFCFSIFWGEEILFLICSWIFKQVKEMTVVGNHSLGLCKLPYLNFSEASYANSTPAKVVVFHVGCMKFGLVGGWRSNFLDPIKAMEVSRTTMHVKGQTPSFRDAKQCADDDDLINNCKSTLPTVGNSSNIVWQKCSVEKSDREKLLNQKGCVVWITGLSGSGKSTLACALNRTLHARGKLAYILDGDNCRHGLNKDLSFEAEDRAENIRRIGEVAKLFADAGLICIASLIAPFRKERDACRALLSEGEFIEVFMDVPLQVCETRDPKGLYKLARAGKIKSFTGVDDPYEPPTNPEIVLHQREGKIDSPTVLAEIVASFLERKGYLEAQFANA